MSEAVVPLSSDTESQPTLAMREAMARAEVGDEQQGRDPTVNRLLERVAALLGHEAALWLPGGTMCNIVAVKTHTQPADVVVADWMAHIVRAESAGAAMLSGVLIEPIETARGVFTPDQLEAALARLVSAPVPYGRPARLACVEQTHNFGGGAVWALEELQAVAEIARSRGLAVHMDGARLLNACVARGVPAAAFGACADSVWIDFTKALGAPIGAVLAGSRAFIDEARRYKHVFGGAMRQAGVAAAGCLHALDHHVDRLAEDHANAARLAAGLGAIDGVRLATPTPDSNIVFFDVSGAGVSNAGFLEGLARRGVRMGEVNGQIRAVTHLDVTAAGVERALDAARAVVTNGA